MSKPKLLEMRLDCVFALILSDISKHPGSDASAIRTRIGLPYDLVLPYVNELHRIGILKEERRSVPVKESCADSAKIEIEFYSLTETGEKAYPVIQSIFDRFAELETLLK